MGSPAARLLLPLAHRRLGCSSNVQPGMSSQLVEQRGLQRLAQACKSRITGWDILQLKVTTINVGCRVRGCKGNHLMQSETINPG